MSLISRFVAHRATTTVAIAICAVFVLTGFSTESTPSCDPGASGPRFQDGEVDRGEQCDDDNRANGDGCSHPLGKQECSVNADCLTLAIIPDEKQFTESSNDKYTVAQETAHALSALRGTTCVDGVCEHAACTTNTDCAAFPSTACKTYDFALYKSLDGTGSSTWPDSRLKKLRCQDSGCTGNADCNSGRTCFETLCEPNCSNDTECSPTEICADVCRQGCRNDNACRLTGGDTLICRTSMGTDHGSCVAGCRELADCEAGERCSVDQECEEDVDCTTNADCSLIGWGTSSPTCFFGRCGPDCTTNADCGPETLCTAETCLAGCVDDEGCDSGRICEADACQEGCRLSEECPYGTACTGNVCEVPVLPSTDPRPCGPENGSRCFFVMLTGDGGGNLGGLAGADALCQARGDASPIAGMAGRTWQALLADSNEGPDDRWIELSSVPYVMLDGTELAVDYTALMSGNLAAEPRVNFAGLPRSFAAIWSGTHNGAASAGAASDFNCNGWTSSDPGDGAMYGFSDQNSIFFIAILIGGTPIPGEVQGFEELECDGGSGQDLGIYCVEMVEQP